MVVYYIVVPTFDRAWCVEDCLLPLLVVSVLYFDTLPHVEKCGGRRGTGHRGHAPSLQTTHVPTPLHPQAAQLRG